MSFPADDGQRISASEAPQGEFDWADEMFNNNNLAAFRAFQEQVKASKASPDPEQQRLEGLAWAQGDPAFEQTRNLIGLASQNDEGSTPPSAQLPPRGRSLTSTASDVSNEHSSISSRNSSRNPPDSSQESFPAWEFDTNRPMLSPLHKTYYTKEAPRKDV
jgi:hypothetical protein